MTTDVAPEVPYFCPLGCYWMCEHRDRSAARPWETPPELADEIARRAEEERAAKPFLTRYARPAGPSGLPAAPLRRGTRGL